MQLILKRCSNFWSNEKQIYFTRKMSDNKFGVDASKVIDVQSLAGDTSDNVPGVPGIGVKTAAELINKYGTFRKTY